MKKKYLPLLLVSALLVLFSCGQPAQAPREENREAKSMLQGIWIEEESEEVSFRAEGDTIFYPDSTSQPASFSVVGDSLLIGTHSYHIVKQTPHLFWFQNQAGDVVKLRKSDDPLHEQDFAAESHSAVVIADKVVKRDSVVFYNGERYHWYIDINPTKYKVVKTTYNDDGVSVDNVYYDNIIHISIFKGSARLYSSNLRKQQYAQYVPENFLQQAILGNMQFDRVDAQGFHFAATLCIPDGASCYMVSTDVSFDGQLTMKLLEY